MRHLAVYAGHAVCKLSLVQVGKQKLHLYRLARHPGGSRCDCVLHSFICESLLTVDVLLLPKAKAKTHLPGVPSNGYPTAPGTLTRHHASQKCSHCDLFPENGTIITRLLRLLLCFQTPLPRKGWTHRDSRTKAVSNDHGCFFQADCRHELHQPACCIWPVYGYPLAISHGQLRH